MKHNKKRNTAFLYEVLLREGTKASLEKDFERLKTIKSLIVEYFHPQAVLGYELSLYKALRSNEIEKSIGEKYLTEVKNRHNNIDKRLLFNEQTKLINKINKSLGANIYNNFVPYYKDLATIAQIFSDSTPIKEKILLEEALLKDLQTLNESGKQELKPIDAIVYRTFVKKFNDKYSSLLNEQKDLLTKYVSSFADNSLELKLYLNEEIDRLNKKISSALELEDIKADFRMQEKTKKLLYVLQEFKSKKDLTPDMLENVLRIQQFVHEVES